jgi:hypothetical protein
MIFKKKKVVTRLQDLSNYPGLGSEGFFLLLYSVLFLKSIYHRIYLEFSFQTKNNINTQLL